MMIFPENFRRAFGFAQTVGCGFAVLMISFSSMQAQENPVESGEKLASTYCLACHQVDRKIVGPSFVEIAGIHRNNPQGIVDWAINPGKKRPDAIQMPSMSFLGEEKLKLIADYMLEAAQGKKEVANDSNGDGGNQVPSLEDTVRPRVQRIFMPDAGPAAIAVAMPGTLSYCWDAGNCQLRYAWRGQFIDPWPVWKGNGNGLATVKGQILFKSAPDQSTHLKSGEDSSLGSRKFLGYRLVDGLPEFRYRVGSVEVTELIKPIPGDSGMTQLFSIHGAGGILRFNLSQGPGVSHKSSAGSIIDGELHVSAGEARSLAIHTFFKPNAD